MGCRPSRHALGKVGDSTWEYNRAFMHEGGGEKRAKQKNKKSGRGRGRKHPTYNDFSSTSKTYYNNSECKSSKITVRLSTDGSTLEIETFDVDFAAYKAEVEGAGEGGSGESGGNSHEATSHVTTVNVHSVDNSGECVGKGGRLHRCESAPELVASNTEPVVWKTWTKVYSTESADDKFTCVDGVGSVLGKDGANVCDLVRGGFAECVRVDMENTGRMARDFGAGNYGNRGNVAEDTIATPEVEQICDIFLKKTITSQSVDGYRSICEHHPDILLQNGSICKEARHTKTCACLISGEPDSRTLPNKNTPTQCHCPDYTSSVLNASEQSLTCTMCLMCKSRSSGRGRGSNSNRRPSSCDTLTCLVLFGSPTGPHGNPCCTLCRTTAYHDYDRDSSPAEQCNHRSPMEPCKHGSPAEPCSKHHGDKAESWRSCLHDRHDSSLSPRHGRTSAHAHEHEHSNTRAKKLSPNQHQHAVSQCVGGMSCTCAARIKNQNQNQHSADITVKLPRCVARSANIEPCASSSNTTVAISRNSTAIDRCCCHSQHTEQPPYQDITDSTTASSSLTLRYRDGEINNLKLCSTCSASLSLGSLRQKNGFHVTSSATSATSASRLSELTPVDVAHQGRPCSIELGNFCVSSRFPINSNSDFKNETVTMATNEVSQLRCCDGCGSRETTRGVVATNGSTTTHGDDDDDDDEYDDGRYSPPRHNWTTDDLEELYYDDCGEYMLANGVLSTYNFGTFPDDVTSDGELEDADDGEYEYGYGYESSPDKDNNEKDDEEDPEAVELQDPFDNIPTVTRAYEGYSAIFDDEGDNSSDDDDDSEEVFIDAVESSYV